MSHLHNCTPCTGVDREELGEFRSWLNHLSLDEMLQSMEFTLTPDDSADSSLELDSSIISPIQSHEHELLEKMLSLQSPLPTPIHPRVLLKGSKHASKNSITDGKDEERRIFTNRLKNPRLFQLSQRPSPNATENMGDEDGFNDNFLGNHADLPPEIAALLALETKKNAIPKKRSGKKRHSETLCRKKYYDVVARKYITSWGQVLSVGSTYLQQNADKEILLGTSIKYGCSSSRFAAGQNTNGYIIPSCKFCISIEKFDSNQMKRGIQRKRTKQSILKMIHISSRGKFLSTRWTQQRKSMSSWNSFCMGWLNPEVEWFSLPMFLASRYEVALWQSFFRSKQDFSNSTVAKAGTLSYVEETMSNFSTNKFLMLVSRAIHDVVKDKVLADNDNVSSGKYRDLIIWKIISCNFFHGNHNQLNFPMFQNIDSALSISLVKYDSTSDKLRKMIVEKLEEIISLETEVQVISSLDTNLLQTKDSEKAIKNAKKKKSKKKKKKPKPKNTTLVILDRIDELSNSSIDKCTHNKSLCNGRKEHTPLQSSINFPPSLNPPSKEQNRSTVMVLSIIEDVIIGTFKKLGFKDEPDDGYKTKLICHDKLENTKQLQASKINDKPKKENKKQNILPQRKNETLQSIKNDSKNISFHTEMNDQIGLDVNQLTMRISNVSSTFGKFPPTQQENETTNNDLILENSGKRIMRHHPISPNPVTKNANNLTNHASAFPNLEYNPNNTDPKYSDKQLHRAFFDGNSPYGLSFDCNGTMNGWSDSQQPNREKSLFADFFLKDETKSLMDQQFVASSTAASIASSSDEYDDAPIVEDTTLDCLDYETDHFYSNPTTDNNSNPLPSFLEQEKKDEPGNNETKTEELDSHSIEGSFQDVDIHKFHDSSNVQLATPEKPQTPPPQPSPILLSLADLGDLKKCSLAKKMLIKELKSSTDAESITKTFAGSLPSSPKMKSQSKTMTPSWSREDLRIPAIQDNDSAMHAKETINRKSNETSLSYRNAAMRHLRKAESTCSHEANVHDTIESTPSLGRRKATDSYKPSKEIIIDGHINIQTCAQSEIALDEHEDSSHWNVIPKFSCEDEVDQLTTTRDGATTISSVPSSVKHDELTILRDERNGYRDMCLTLAAEVSKLKNVLAAEKGKVMHTFMPYSHQSRHNPYYCASSYDPEYMPMYLQNIRSSSPRTLGAMSDVGLNNDTPMSDTGSTADMPGKVWANQAEYMGSQRQVSTCGTVSGTIAPSDTASTEHTTIAQSGVSLTTFCRQNRENLPEHLNGMRSRLTKDINTYLLNTTSKLKKQQGRRTLAVKRLTRLVTALWPRAQVKLYGSHVSNLCLPSSDLDFIVCLPAVHKNAPAEAPGVLEGRNAINESKQKLLARKLKMESWIGMLNLSVDFYFHLNIFWFILKSNLRYFAI